VLQVSPGAYFGRRGRLGWFFYAQAVFLASCSGIGARIPGVPDRTPTYLRSTRTLVSRGTAPGSGDIGRGKPEDVEHCPETFDHSPGLAELKSQILDRRAFARRGRLRGGPKLGIQPDRVLGRRPAPGQGVGQLMLKILH
jgi:hypothetical protein